MTSECICILEIEPLYFISNVSMMSTSLVILAIYISLLIGKMSENPETWFENYILDITEEPMKGELYTLFDGIYIFFVYVPFIL